MTRTSIRTAMAATAAALLLAGPVGVATAAPARPQVTAVIASGDPDHQVDALVAGPLASAVGTGVLLTSSASAPQPLLQHLYDRGATTVYVIGGEQAISQHVVDQVVAEFGTQDPVTIRRVGGADRFATALLVTEATEQARR